MLFLGLASGTALDLLSQSLGAARSLASNASTNAAASGFLNQFGLGGNPTITSASGTPTTPTVTGPTGSNILSADVLSTLILNQSQQAGGGVPSLTSFQARLFAKLDTNHDGVISKSEFEQAFGQNGNVAAADALFAKLDTNNDGTIDPSELAAGIQDGRNGHHHFVGANLFDPDNPGQDVASTVKPAPATAATT